MKYKEYEFIDNNIYAPNGSKIWHDDENNITSFTKFKAWVNYHIKNNDFTDKYNPEYNEEKSILGKLR